MEAEICIKSPDPPKMIGNITTTIGKTGLQYSWDLIAIIFIESLSRTAMLASVPFILITFLVYGFIPELRNLHGKCLLCYLVCLLLNYIPLATVQLYSIDEINETSCKLAAFIIYFSYVSSFIWSSVISSNVWSCFGYVYHQHQIFCSHFSHPHIFQHHHQIQYCI